MNTLDAIEQRRSVKMFDPNHQLTDDELNSLIKAAQATPTSFHIQHWRLLRITDKALRNKVQDAAWNQAQVGDASELLVITADTQAWQKSPDRYWKMDDTEKQEMLVNMLTDFYSDNEQLQRDEAIRSGALVGQTLMLAAKAIGYDSCPMIGFDAKEVGKLIELPEDHVIVMLLAIGKAKEAAWPRTPNLPVEEVVLANTF